MAAQVSQNLTRTDSPDDGPKVRARSREREQRATVRYPSQKDGACQPIGRGEGVAWEAKVRDVSADGIGLVLCRRFEPGTLLLIDVPPTPEESGRRLLVRVVRVQQVSPRRWELGCVFPKALSAEDVQNLR